ncbi:MAG: ABC transporter ATP-binding protein [Bacteroidota bacterium]
MRDQQFTNKKALWPFLLRMFRYSMRYKSWLLTFAFWTVVIAAVDAVFPLVLLGLLDHGVTPQLEALKQAVDSGEAFQPDYSGILFYGIGWILMGILQGIGIFILIKYAGRLQEHLMFDLRRDLFNKLQRLSFSFYDRSASGWLLTRITSDTDRVCEVISWGLLDAIWGICVLLMCLGAMLFYSWKLALVVLIAIPLMLLSSVKLRLLVLKYARESRRINSEITASYNEHINGVSVIKSSGQEQRVSDQFSLLSGRMRQASYRSSYYTAMYRPFVIFTGAIVAAIVIFWGGKMATALPLGISIGFLVASIEYATRIFLPIQDISGFYALAQSSLSAGERIFSLLDEKITVKDREGAPPFGTISGDLEFRNLNFAYVEGQPILENFNLKIEAGQSVALVGATGEGKSTIINLVARFYEPTGGQLLIDGVDYMERSIGSLRQQTAIVLQTPHLFAGTIRDNVRYGHLEADDEQLIKALRQAGGEGFIDRLDEEVGEGGERLSEGEKQLISFARAILAAPRILIMDEATSSIDTLTESRIQQGITRLLEGRTSIIIAHRLSTIKNCDRILLIKRGKIIEDGAHKQLMKQQGAYFQLYTRQMREQQELVSE